MQGIKETQQSLNRVSVRFYESRLRGSLGVSEINIAKRGVFVHRAMQAPWPRRSQLSIELWRDNGGFGGGENPRYR